MTPLRTGGHVDETVTDEMTLDEAREIVAGTGPPLVDTGEDIEVTMCSGCGVMIGHRASHGRFHAALYVIATYLAAVSGDAEGDDENGNLPRLGANGQPV